MTRAECQAIWKAAKRGDDARLTTLLSSTSEGSQDGGDVARNQVNWVHHRRGTTPLMVAAASNGRRANGSAECVRLLLARGADANATSLSQDMSTPLHFAAEGKSDDPMVVELLLSAGADPFAVNRRGHTPLDVARIRHRKLVARALTERMQVNADWLHLRGSFRWRKRWGVLLACNASRSATELCVFKNRDAVRPEAVLLLDETSTAFRFASADSYCWLKRAHAFTLSKPVMCQQVRRDKFTRAPVCRKTMSFGDSETRNVVFAADGEAKLDAWMRALSRSNGRRFGSVGSGSLTASNSTGLRSTENEMFYWPHELRQSLALQHQPRSDPTLQMPAELTAASIVVGPTAASQNRNEDGDNDPFPPSQRRLERAQSAGARVARPERSVTFAPVISTSDDDASPLEQLRQQYREYQEQRRQQERELATQDSSGSADSVDVAVANQQDASSSPQAAEEAEQATVGAPSDQPTRELCLICADAPRDAVCTPCGHLSACHSCLRTIIRSTRTCPICRARIRSVMRIYDA